MVALIKTMADDESAGKENAESKQEQQHNDDTHIDDKKVKRIKRTRA